MALQKSAAPEMLPHLQGLFPCQATPCSHPCCPRLSASMSTGPPAVEAAQRLPSASGHPAQSIRGIAASWAVLTMSPRGQLAPQPPWQGRRARARQQRACRLCKSWQRSRHQRAGCRPQSGATPCQAKASRRCTTRHPRWGGACTGGVGADRSLFCAVLQLGERARARRAHTHARAHTHTHTQARTHTHTQGGEFGAGWRWLCCSPWVEIAFGE